MDVLLLAAILFGTSVSGTSASCDTSACTGATSTRCSILNAYIVCMTTVQGTCTDIISRAEITTSLTAARASATVQGCNGQSGDGASGNCDTSTCIGGGSTSCSVLYAYIVCMSRVQGTCTETITRAAITTTLTAANASANVQGCSGTSGSGISGTCDISACTGATSTTCSLLNVYIVCMTAVQGTCTEIISRATISAALTAATASANIQGCNEQSGDGASGNCDTSTCIGGGSTSCSVLYAYIVCMTRVQGTCTETITKAAITTTLTAANASANVQDCSGTSGIGMSGTCDISACTGATSTTCSVLNAYIVCMTTVQGTCTETITRATISAALTSATASANVQGCSVQQSPPTTQSSVGISDNCDIGVCTGRDSTTCSVLSGYITCMVGVWGRCSDNAAKDTIDASLTDARALAYVQRCSDAGMTQFSSITLVVTLFTSLL